MAVKFEFVLCDDDAENLIEILGKEKARCLHKASKAMADAAKKSDPEEFKVAEWYNRHADYIDNLKLQILQGHVRVAQ